MPGDTWRTEILTDTSSQCTRCEALKNASKSFWTALGQACRPYLQHVVHDWQRGRHIVTCSCQVSANGVLVQAASYPGCHCPAWLDPRSHKSCRQLPAAVDRRSGKLSYPLQHWHMLARQQCCLHGHADHALCWAALLKQGCLLGKQSAALCWLSCAGGDLECPWHARGRYNRRALPQPHSSALCPAECISAGPPLQRTAPAAHACRQAPMRLCERDVHSPTDADVILAAHI